MYAIEGGQTTSVEFCKINPEIARDIDDIFSSPEEVYASFVTFGDVDPTTIDPLDLQAHHIAKLQTQRRDLLQDLHLIDTADSIRQPRMYFEAITSSFFDQCGQDRLLWGRARISDRGVAETAHTGTFRHDGEDIVEPEIRARITYVTPRDEYEERSKAGTLQPQFFELVTDLQNTKPGTRYRFYSSDHARGGNDGLAIEEISNYGTNTATYTPVVDAIDRFTLLQALTVDLHASVSQIQHDKDVHARRILGVEVYGMRTPR
jgi:hypothetical protein